MRPSGIDRAGKCRMMALAGHPKLLNMRDFRAGSGFPLAAKTRYNLTIGNPARASVWPVSAGMAMDGKTCHWPGQV